MGFMARNLQVIHYFDYFFGINMFSCASKVVMDSDLARFWLHRFISRTLNLRQSTKASLKKSEKIYKGTWNQLKFQPIICIDSDHFNAY